MVLGWVRPKPSNTVLRSLRVIPNSNSWLQNKSFRGSQRVRTESKGGISFGSQDDIIFIPITTAQKFLAGVDYVSTINIQVENSQLMD